MPPRLRERGGHWSCIIRKWRRGVPAQPPTFPRPLHTPIPCAASQDPPTKGFSIVPRVKTRREGKESP